MTKLIRVGFFRELAFNPTSDESRKCPSIRDCVSNSAQEHEAQIVRYLRDAVCVAAAGCFVTDVLDPSSKVALHPHTYTDGTYLWPLNIAYYVEKYHLRLPAEFIRHMAGRDWRPPTEDEVDIESLE